MHMTDLWLSLQEICMSHKLNLKRNESQFLPNNESLINLRKFTHDTILLHVFDLAIDHCKFTLSCFFFRDYKFLFSYRRKEFISELYCLLAVKNKSNPCFSLRLVPVLLLIYINRFHVAVRLFSNRSQMTSKCGKNKKVAHEAIAECVTDVLTTFWCPLWSIYWTDARQHGIYLFYTIKKQTTAAFLFQNSKADLCPLRRIPKKPFDVISVVKMKMKQSHWLLSVAKELWLV